MTDQLEGSPVLRDVLGDAYDAMAMFHGKLEAEGEERGIIGPRDADIIWERHILNSAAAVPFIAQKLGPQAVEGKRKASIADVGSGGGLPGIVIAAMLPHVPITLIEPMERRVEWLEECVDELHLDNVEILRARAEDVPRNRRFDVVTCRAVASLAKQLAGWTLPLLRPHGRLVALKGQSAQAEIDKAAAKIKQYGGVNPRVVEAPVANGLEPTHVVLIDHR